MRNSHCAHCGSAFMILEYKWRERKCNNCGEFSWNNPAAVGVVLIPIVNTNLEPAPFMGILGIRRGEAPGKGELALPGGHLEAWESWQEGSAREIQEEVKWNVLADEIKLFDVISTHNNYIITFSTCNPRSSELIKTFVPNPEVEELIILKEPTELTFPSHTEALKRFFERYPNGIR